MKPQFIRALSAAVTVALAAVAVGCGETAKQHFIAQSNGLCRDMNQQLRHASRPAYGNVDPKELFARFARERRAARREFYRGFLALHAPDDHPRALQEQFRAVVRMESQLLARVGDRDLTDRQAQKLAELPQTKRFGRAARELNADMRAYGLSCPARMRW
jgi:hypothetical protein